jgi:hypothetical protein
MREKPQAPAPQRPLATDAEIRAMHERAAAHEHAADMHEAQAQHEIAAAQRLASDMVANAQAKANELIHEANQSAAAHERQADERAKEMRAVKAAEEQKALFWKSLAADEVARAGLSPVPPTAPLDTVEGEAAP